MDAPDADSPLVPPDVAVWPIPAGATPVPVPGVTPPPDLTPPADLGAPRAHHTTATPPPGYAPGAFPAPPGYPAARVFPVPAGTSGPPGYRAPPGLPAPLAAWPAPPSCEVPPRRRRRWPVPVLVTIALVAAGGGVYAAGRHSPAARPAALVSGAPSPTPTAATPSPTPANTLNELLTTQAAALMAGDEKAFMATVDPAAKHAMTAYRQLYRNLRALHVAFWSPFSVAGRGTVTKRATASVDIVYCLVSADCQRGSVTLTVSVAPHKDGPLLESLTRPARNNRDWEPYPWEASPLHVVEGARVILAATDDESPRLASLLSVAERAAAVADAFAHWGKPAKYLVFLAGQQEWSVWFGGMDRNAIGEEVPVGPSDDEVVILLPEALSESGPGGVRATIQHELGHVATLLGAVQWRSDSLVEGMAQYIAYDGHPSWASGDVSAVGWYLRSGRWSGQCYLTKEINLSNINVSNAAYGIGYLMVKYLVGRYGLDTTLNFFSAVDRHGGGLDTASRQEFGSPWKTVNSGCAAYVHRAAHA